jgi:hypothetical protein
MVSAGSFSAFVWVFSWQRSRKRYIVTGCFNCFDRASGVKQRCEQLAGRNNRRALRRMGDIRCNAAALYFTLRVLSRGGQRYPSPDPSLKGRGDFFATLTRVGQSKAPPPWPSPQGGGNHDDEEWVGSQGAITEGHCAAWETSGAMTLRSVAPYTCYGPAAPSALPIAAALI